VEVLVVIAVIGILATISIVVYRNVQDSAYNAKALSIVDSYEKAIKLYYLKNKDYPRYVNDDVDDQWVCLGTTAQYPARDGYAAGVCEVWDAGPDVITDNAFMAELRKEMGSDVDGNLPSVDYGGGRARGVQFHRSGQSLDYYVKGSQKCPRGIKTIVNDKTRCVVKINV
jgi:type II secretory pathway pseudopilin PulG